MFEISHQQIMQMYEQLVRPRAFIKALNYLKEKGDIKSDAEAAKKCGISPTSISQYISGDRQPTKEFIERFESEYKILIADVGTYTELSFIDEYMKKAGDTMPSRPYYQSEYFFRTIVDSTMMIMASQKEQNDKLFLMVQMLYSVYITQELWVVKQVSSGTHYANIEKDKKNHKHNHHKKK